MLGPVHRRQLHANDQWQPALTVSPDGSRLFIGFYDRRHDAANLRINAYGAIASVSSGTVNIESNFLVSSADFPPEVDEFEISGLTPIPSDVVKPPRVRESRVQMEVCGFIRWCVKPSWLGFLAVLRHFPPLAFRPLLSLAMGNGAWGS